MISIGREGRVQEFCTAPEQNEVNVICRLCGQCSRDVISVFSEEAHRKHLLLKIQTRLLIQISASDPLPKNACANCLEKLDSFWDFTELCQRTQIKLQEMFIKQRRDEHFTLLKDQGNIGTSHPPSCSLSSFTHQTTQDTSDSALGNKRIKLEPVPFCEEEPVCLDENSYTLLAPAITSSAGALESYQNANREISAEPSKNSNISVKLDLQHESDTIVKNLCLSEMVDAIVRRNMLALQDCDIGESRSTVSVSVKNSDHWKTVSSDLNDSSLGQQGRLQNVLKTKPIIDKVDSVNSSTVQNHCRKINAESSSNSNISVRSNYQQKSDVTVKKLCLDGTVRRKMSLLQDCDSGEGIDRGSSASPSLKMSNHLRATSSDLIDDSLDHQGKRQDILQTKPVTEKQAPLDHINSSAIQENRNSPIISISHGEIVENVLLDRTDSWLASTRTAEGGYSPLRRFLSDNQIERGVSLNGTQQVEERISVRNLLSCRNNQEALLSVCIDDCVSQQQINENSSRRSSSESINQSVNTGASNFQLDKVENITLRSLLYVPENLEKEGRATLQKEGTDNHVRKSVSQEGIRSSTLEEKQKCLASDSDTVYRCGKLYDGDGSGSGNSDCVNSFSCHDCGSSFSCKNSLTYHIFKQHIHARQTNTPYATPPTAVTLDCLDSSINELSSSDVASVHSANNCDNVLQKSEEDSKLFLAQGKSREDAQASNCNLPSVDDSDFASNTTHVKPIETELRPTTIDEARLLCEEYSERICETSGENPKINMINVKVELPSGDIYTGKYINYIKFFKPFVVLHDSRYNCQICKTTLNTRDAIVKHIGTHFNLFPYCCKICDKRYTLLSSANTHIKLHSSKLVCKQCGAVCKSQSSLFKHVQIHDKPFCCHDCGERFSSKDRIRCHILKEHMKIRSYLCKICGKAYFHESNVATHMIFAHADKKITCQYCGKMYFRNNMLKVHIKRWHT